MVYIVAEWFLCMHVNQKSGVYNMNAAGIEGIAVWHV